MYCRFIHILKVDKNAATESLRYKLLDKISYTPKKATFFEETVHLFMNETGFSDSLLEACQEYFGNFVEKTQPEFCLKTLYDYLTVLYNHMRELPDDNEDRKRGAETAKFLMRLFLNVGTNDVDNHSQLVIQLIDYMYQWQKTTPSAFDFSWYWVFNELLSKFKTMKKIDILKTNFRYRLL